MGKGAKQKSLPRAPTWPPKPDQAQPRGSIEYCEVRVISLASPGIYVHLMRVLEGDYAMFSKRRSPPVPQEDVVDLEDNKSIDMEEGNQKMRNLPRYWRKVVWLLQRRPSGSVYIELVLSKRAGPETAI